jgi:hypothetical protein
MVRQVEEYVEFRFRVKRERVLEVVEAAIEASRKLRKGAGFWDRTIEEYGIFGKAQWSEFSPSPDNSLKPRADTEKERSACN